MKLLRFGEVGKEKPGCLDTEGRIRDLSALITDLGPAEMMPAVIDRLKSVDLRTLPLVCGNPRLGSPIANPPNIIGIGLNYKNHGPGVDMPPEPMVFFKHTSSLCGANDPILRPAGAIELDYEAELAVIIGMRAYCIDRNESVQCIAGYVMCNDVSERDYQNNRGGGFCKGKSSPGFTPLGPYLVTPDEIENPANLKIICKVNGRVMQDSSTAEMLFPVDYLIAYLSQFMQLMPGDVITTGTPARTMALSPKLVPEDVVEISIVGLGERCQIVQDCKKVSE